MKRWAWAVAAGVFLASPVWSADAATEDAKATYRAYLQQLKQLNQQYKQITGQIAEVVKEEGLPTWEASPAEKQISDMVSAAYVDPRVRQTDKEIRVYLELSGLLRNTIKVALENSQTLKVTAQKRVADDVSSVEQKVELPAAALEKGARARYTDGVLEVTLPKDLAKPTSSSTIPVS